MTSCVKPSAGMQSPDEPHYYVAGYSAADDPYAQPNGVLINNLGITDTATLDTAEGELAAARLLAFWEDDHVPTFDLGYLCYIHHYLFQDIYPWAGQLRQVDIGKGDSIFMPHTMLKEQLEQLFARLAEESFLHGLAEQEFCQRAAWYLGRLNTIHAFREGNGRTQREFIGRLALNAGYIMDWSGCSKGAMRTACIAAEQDDYVPLARILKVGISPFSE